MANRKWRAPRLADLIYVTAEEAARQLGVSISVVYDRVRDLTGDWHKEKQKWRINVEALRRVLEDEQRWKERVSQTHAEVPPEPIAPPDTRPEPDWDALPKWLDAHQAASVLGLSEHQLGLLANQGVIDRKEKPKLTQRGRTWRGGPMMVWVRFWYALDDVRRYWHIQEKRSRNRALRGESFHHWGPRDKPDTTSRSWQDTMDTAAAANVLGVCREHVALLCRKGVLPAYQNPPGRSGSRLHIPTYAVLALADRPDRLYWREVHAVTNKSEEAIDAYGGVAARRADRERREQAIEERREIGRQYGRETDRAHTLRTDGWEPEEGMRREAGLGHYEWISPREPHNVVYCSPQDREFGEREIEHGDFYSTSQAARILSVQPRRVLDLRQWGRLRGYRIKKDQRNAGRRPRCWFFRKEDVESEAERLRRKRKQRWHRKNAPDEEEDP